VSANTRVLIGGIVIDGLKQDQGMLSFKGPVPMDVFEAIMPSSSTIIGMTTKGERLLRRRETKKSRRRGSIQDRWKRWPSRDQQYS